MITAMSSISPEHAPHRITPRPPIPLPVQRNGHWSISCSHHHIIGAALLDAREAAAAGEPHCGAQAKMADAVFAR